MWIEYNPNPSGRRVGDCAVRAVSKALGVDWETAFAMMTANAFLLNDMPSSDSVWGSVLKEHGFEREAIPNSCPNCYTAADFARDNTIGTFVLGFGGHTACIEDGNLYDSFDSSREIPIFVWYRKD